MPVMHRPTAESDLDVHGCIRREFLSSFGRGLCGMALASLYDGPTSAETHSGSAAPKPGEELHPRKSHFSPKADAVIQLFMNCGPSQMDLFDPKPQLTRHHGKPYFEKIAGEVENPQAAGDLMRSPFKFSQHGQSGMWVSDAMPHLSQCVDHLAVIRSMYTTNLTHEPALFKIHSGQTFPGLPTLGAWVSYGLGTENQNLPAYVVLDDPRGLPINRTQNWQAGFLSPVYQGTRFRSKGAPVLNLKREFDEPDDVTRVERNLVRALDQIHLDKRPHLAQLQARISSYELAARMQLSASEVLDLSGETRETLDLYGIDQKTTDSYGRRCLYARRLVERGVRFVQLFIDSQIWDNHTSLASGLKSACDRTDQPVAALLTDLSRRGMLDRTLVVWGGEMGRLPISQLPGDKKISNAGRDHNKNAMCSWVAGGGIRGGTVYGTTDELGFRAEQNPVSVQDWHATILHALGLDHERLTYNRNGLESKLTGTFETRVVEELFN